MSQYEVIKLMLDNGNGWFKLGDVKKLAGEGYSVCTVSRCLSKLKFGGALFYDRKKQVYKLNMEDYDVKQVLGQQVCTLPSASKNQDQ